VAGTPVGGGALIHLASWSPCPGGEPEAKPTLALLTKDARVSKRSIIKITGFIGTLGAGAALVAGAATGTGAYFTSSLDGSIAGKSGHLTLTSTSDRILSFDDLMPGQDVMKNVDYKIDVSSGTSDVWLTFDPSTAGYQAFTGAKGNALVPDGGLGRFGHFKVAANGGTLLFDSYNLQLPPVGTANCTDVNGHGWVARPTSRPETPPYCGVPTAILVASDVPDTGGGTIGITYGVTGRATGQRQDQPTVGFKLVATQHGVRPDAANF